MQISANFEVGWAKWVDPGSYPNALAGGPLPSYSYPEEIMGECVITTTDGELLSQERLEEIAQDNCPAKVTKWTIETAWKRHPDGEGILSSARLTVEEFDPDSVERDEGTED
jgi:hypothetical protein